MSATPCTETRPDGKPCPLLEWIPFNRDRTDVPLEQNGMCKFHRYQDNRKPVLMPEVELKKLPEYSSSLPTGTTVGKKWRRHQQMPVDQWWLCEYVEHPDKGYVGIIYRPIVISPVTTFVGDRLSP